MFAQLCKHAKNHWLVPLNGIVVWHMSSISLILLKLKVNLKKLTKDPIQRVIKQVTEQKIYTPNITDREIVHKYKTDSYKEVIKR